MVMSYFKLSLMAVATLFYAILSFIGAILFYFFSFKGYIYHFIARIWSKTLFILSGVKITIDGIDNLDKKANYLFVSNHLSNFDINILCGKLPFYFLMLAKKELGRIPIFGWALALGGYIMVDRNNSDKARKAFIKATNSLKGGKSILLFPEGTRSDTGEIGSFRKGASLLALQSKCAIAPITIIGSNNVFAKNSFRFQKADVKVIINKPIMYEDYAGKNSKIISEMIKERILASYKSNEAL